MKQYLFAYGSLINPKSRHLQSGIKHGQKVVIKGYQRAWNIAVPKIKATVLGLVKKNKAQTNGIIFKVSDKELEKFDQRELPAGYKRIAIAPKDIKIEKAKTPPAKFFAYLSTKPKQPTKNQPIIQTYVDVVLSGALNYGKKFAQDFIKTTSGWKFARVDDRAKPRYPRALKNLKYKKIIDRLMKETRN